MNQPLSKTILSIFRSFIFLAISVQTTFAMSVFVPFFSNFWSLADAKVIHLVSSIS
jgi:hypothetical protein